MLELNRVAKRKALKPRREPYWMELERGRSLGFRRLTADSIGSWIARIYHDSYRQKPLGEFGTLPEQERFSAAKRAAEEWFQHLAMGGSTDRVTVKQACEGYIQKLREDKGESAALGNEGHLRRMVYADPIARVELAKLTPRHVADWKRRTLAKGGSRSYFNRNATVLRAALNLAKSRREVVSDQAWSEELKPLKHEDNRRTLYLDRAKRRELEENAGNEVRYLIATMNLLPLRPGEVVNARVEDFDARHGMLRVHGKTGTRVIPLPPEAVGHFKRCAKDKLPNAWLLSRSNGAQWDRFAWRDEIKLAAAAAKLSPATCLYTLRHSTITDLVTSGLDIFTVAKISGTSVAMIEKHYGHLQREHARQALKRLALK